MAGLILAAALALSLAIPGAASGQTDADFTLIRDWTPIGTVDSRAVADTLLLSSGTIHTGTDYADFVFRFDYRLPSKTAGAALLLRVNQDENGKAGAVVAEGSLLDKPAGRIGFRAGPGGIELRGMRVATIAKPRFHIELAAATDPGITPPTVKKHATPVYPERARQQRISGTVLVDIVILPDGLIGDLQIGASPHPDLIPAAIACLRKWRFNPAQKDGVPVAVTATVEVAFNLTR